jgi:hypothetical protein
MVKNKIIEWLKDIKYSMVRLWKDIDSWFYHLPNRIRRSISWAIFMWSNEDWDYHYLYQVLSKKLKDMEKQLKKGWGIHKSSVSRLIRLCVRYFELGYDNEFTDDLYLAFEKRYGKITMRDEETGEVYGDKKEKLFRCIFGFKKDNGEVLWQGTVGYERVSNLHHRIGLITERKRQEYLRRAWYILEKYSEYFWD